MQFVARIFAPMNVITSQQTRTDIQTHIHRYTSRMVAVQTSRMDEVWRGEGGEEEQETEEKAPYADKQANVSLKVTKRMSNGKAYGAAYGAATP